MRKILLWCCLILVGAAVLTPSSRAGTNNQNRTTGPIPIEFEGNPFTFATEPQNMNNHLMVPVQELGSLLGIDVATSEDLRTVTTSKETNKIVWTLGQAEAVTPTGKLALTQAAYEANGQVMVPLRDLTEALGYFTLWDDSRKVLTLHKETSNLPIVGSAERLSSLLEENKKTGISPDLNDKRILMKSDGIAVTTNAAATSVPSAPEAKEKRSDTSDYSTTNVQTEGVDEADVIKTDGTYLYQVNRQKVVISQTVPASDMKIVSTLNFPDSNMQPSELYVDDKHLIIIGTKSTQEEPAVQSFEMKTKISIPIKSFGHQTVKAIIYDIHDKSNPTKLREVEIDGSYVNSRKIGDALYLIANKGINTQFFKENEGESSMITSPSYRDTAVDEGFIQLTFDRIRYFPQAIVPNYVVIGGLDLSAPEQQMNVASYVGSGKNVYASESNLYVAVTAYTKDVNRQPYNPDTPVMKDKVIAPASYATDTLIYKFKLDHGQVSSIASGSVPGTILNQFAMDEHNGYFRIATTKGEVWKTDEKTSKNNVYVLDDKMKATGKLEDLAPGERIYSVRFMGDRAYLVTFKKIDPLFVVDLKNPQAPAILGKLKIPGYSDYLHPFDENHLIGFGKDAVETTNEWDDKGSTTAYYQGMKIALFDVSDVANPVELYKESIGDRGTDSELLHNPKALLFSKEKGILAFPVKVAEKKESAKSATTEYGQFTFQGLYVYHLDLNQGFQLKGRITHLSQNDLEKSGDSWYGSSLNIQRGLWIGNVLYSVSPSMIKANDLSSLQELGELKLP